MEPRPALERTLGYRFHDRHLLARALTHRSFSSEHNERLEFLGDAVLGLVVAGMLFHDLNHGSEGALSRLRSQLVREESLHQLAEKIGLPDAVRVGSGEAHAGGRHRASILADALEAVLGAIYLDGGYAAADGVVRRLFADVPITAERAARAKDAKTALQEWLQAHKMDRPVYAVERITGAAHRQTFAVSCAVQGPHPLTHGEGKSRRAAEQIAARAMLDQLRKNLSDA